MKDPRKSVFKKSLEPKQAIAVHGFDFSQSFNFEQFLQSFYFTGFQAHNLSKAIDLVKQMRKEKVRIFLGFTSNIISSGLRENIVFLTQGKLVDVLVTTAGGIEEDLAKTHKPFLLGSFDLDGAKLRKKGVNRIGNLLVPNERYIWFEKFMRTFLNRIYAEQKKTGKIIHIRELLYEIGKEISNYPNCESSYLYWAYKNNIPVFCPGIIDGSAGDQIYFFKKDHSDFLLDSSKDVIEMDDLALTAEKTGAIILGGSLPKHFIMNANQLREGADFVVYINSHPDFDGSDSGANLEEAKSWGKAAHNENSVKVFCDATIAFPLLIAGSFWDKLKKN
ncbi:MAG: deoxyhypusine synthase [Candidatus Diapherotrites archaeon]|nr:deoxyhypusine synthase [Candidatus Diapherotrites archaeon]